MGQTLMTDTRAFIESVPLFKGAPERALDVAASVVQLRNFSNQSIIFQEGDVGEALYILVDGLVKLSKVDLGGYEKTLALLQPPEFFGEMALLGAETRNATAQAFSDVQAYLLFGDDFKKLIETYPSRQFEPDHHARQAAERHQRRGANLVVQGRSGARRLRFAAPVPERCGRADRAG